jgi:hypothetical protein
MYTGLEGSRMLKEGFSRVTRPLILCVLTLLVLFTLPGCIRVYEISDNVIDSEGNPMVGVSLIVGGKQFAITKTTGDGSFEFSNLTGTATITPFLEGWEFTPSHLTISGSDDDANFVGTPSQNPEITFKDPNLEMAVRIAIDKAEGAIYKTNVISLTRLEARDMEIHWLDGIQHLTGLEYLHIGGNHIRDIALLATLTSLESLWIQRNSITDISPISNLINLRDLGCGSNHDNKIRDISPVINLVNIERLLFTFQQLRNIEPLLENEGLGFGDYVDLRHNYLTLAPGSRDMQVIRALQERGVKVLYDPQMGP